jgi:hypothetical protein
VAIISIPELSRIDCIQKNSYNEEKCKKEVRRQCFPFANPVLQEASDMATIVSAFCDSDFKFLY